MAILEVTDIHTYYGDTHILNGISLEVGERSIISILGRNGMGKTTTIRSIIGFNPPRQGIIRYKGITISGQASYKISQMGIALVPQGRRIFPSLSVKENLVIGMRDTKGKQAWTLDKIYSRFPILKERCNNPGNTLSGGEQQMLAIGRALLTNPDLILMDEPSEGLSPLIAKEIGNILMELKEFGISVLLVEQNLKMALNISDYIYIISKGKIVYQSNPNTLAEDKVIQGKYLGVEINV